MRKGLLLGGSLVFFVVVLLASGLVSSQKTESEILFVDGKTIRNGITVAQIGDLHYPFQGVEPSEILSILRENKPNIIFLTGDILDGESKKEDILACRDFLRKLSETAPCFAVLGNHEIGHPLLQEIRCSFEEGGVVLLENEGRTVTVCGERITVYGVSDAYPYNNAEKTTPIFLLAHRPERFSEYLAAEAPPDYVFSGHAHGGQVRVASTGLYAPDQGWFPTYTSGVYERNGRYLFVTRGLGGRHDFRINNPYHLLFIEIIP